MTHSSGDWIADRKTQLHQPDGFPMGPDCFFLNICGAGKNIETMKKN
jgi:hypothetical protein